MLKRTDVLTLRAVVVLALCLLAQFAAAAPDAVMRRGLHPDGVYDFSGIDSVDMYTGNLSLEIPLGHEYSTNGSLAYRFMLRYNSSIWDFYDQSDSAVVLTVEQSTDQFVRLPKWFTDGNNVGQTEAAPAIFNAGLGWRFSFGDIIGGPGPGGGLIIRYADETGAERVFFSVLHGDINWDSEPLSGSGPFYTRDGSYLRLRRTDSGGLIKVEIDSPDGIVRRFTCRTCNNGQLASQWTLDEVADPFGNVLVITRTHADSQVDQSVRPAVGMDWTWTFTEKAAGRDGYATAGTATAVVRTHEATFGVRRVYMDINGVGQTRELWGELRLKELRLAVCCDAGQGATYHFGYEDRDIYRPPQSNYWGGAPILPDNANGGVTLSLLKSVALPVVDGATAGKWEFDYVGDGGVFANDSSDDAGAYTVTDGIGHQHKYSWNSGRLQAVRYPTSGGIWYRYGPRAWIKEKCDPHYGVGPLLGGLFHNTYGIARKQMFSSTGASVGRPWHYLTNKFRFPAAQEPCGIQPLDITAAVISPTGMANFTYYSNYVHNQNAGGFDYREYGMPFTRYEEDPLAPGYRYLSTEVYDCSAADLSDPADLVRRSIARFRKADDAPGCEGPLRKTYVHFDTSGFGCDPSGPVGSCSQANRRLASSRTVYRDVCKVEAGRSPHCKVDPVFERSASADYSNFDGLGHYRTLKTSGDFYAQAFNSDPDRVKRDQRTQTTWYNNGVTYDASTHAVSPSPRLTDSSWSWVLGTYSFTKVSAFDETDQTAAAQYRFHCATPGETPCRSSNGFMEGWRRVKTAGGQDPHTGPPDPNLFRKDDVMMRRTRSYAPETGTGQAVRITEHYFGGSVQNGLSDRSDGSLTGPMPPPAAAEYAIRKTLAFGTVARTEYLCNDNPFLLIEQNVVDPGSGLVTESRDAWGMRAGGSASTFSYDALARFKSSQVPGGTATAYDYPPMTVAASQWTVSGTQDGGTDAGKIVQKYSYDSLGRVVATERTVKSGVGRVKRTYGDDLLLKSQSNEGTGNRFSELTNDIFGRVLKTSVPVSNDADDPDPVRDVTVTYFGTQRKGVETKGVATSRNGTSSQSVTQYFDVMGRLIKVDEPIGATTKYGYDYADRLTSVKGNNGPAQVRKFAYDGRGFLVSETPPELAGLQLWHDAIDSRGNAHGRRYGTGSGEPGSSPTGSPLFDLTFQFDNAERLTAVFNGTKALKTFEYVDGKLTKAGRINVVPEAYADTLPERDSGVTTSLEYNPAGQLKTKRVRGGGITVDTGFGYNGLGLVKTLSYPACTGGPCSAMGPSRTLTYGYVGGALNSVSGFVNSVDYHSNGLWKKVIRSNGTVDEQTIQDDYPRPASVKTTCPSCPGSVAFNSGAIWYDGYGNVKHIGAERYAYDAVGRLKNAYVGTIEQAFTYDRYGNMLSMKTKDTAGEMTTAFTIGTSGGELTNRLSKIGDVAIEAGHYDRAGNLKKWSDPRRPGFLMDLAYDPFNLIKHAFLTKTTAPTRREFGRIHLYDAMDERVATIDYVNRAPGDPLVRQTWFFRGADNEVLREAIHEKHDRGSGVTSTRWRWGRDYIYRGGSLAAEIAAPPAPPPPGTPSYTPALTRHMHLDHLGSVRAITKENGTLAEQRRYLPFGEQVVSSIPDSRRAFAGHERDDDQMAGSHGDLDYMHARYYAPMIGRFLSIDPAGGAATQPQSWNRYAYAMNSPLTLTDPSGALPVYGANDPDGDGETGCYACGDSGGGSSGNSLVKPPQSAGGSQVPDTAPSGQPSAPLLISEATVSEIDDDGATQVLANLIHGVGEGTTGNWIVTNLAAAFGYDDPDLARKTEMVNQASPEHRVGQVAGAVAMTILGNRWEGIFKSPKLPPVVTPGPVMPTPSTPPTTAPPAQPRPVSSEDLLMRQLRNQLQRLKEQRQGRSK